MPGSNIKEKVVRGKNGRLFLDNDTNAVLAQHSGSFRFSEAQLREWRYVLETRIAWLEKKGIDHHFLVAPNSHSVYPEDLPAGYGSGERRPILQLLQYLETQGSYARILYPIDALIREKHRRIYPETDTHWSELGGFVAYRQLMQEIGQKFPVRPVSEGDLRMKDWDVVGDLGEKLTPPESSIRVRVNVRDRKAELVSDNRVVNQGRRVEYKCVAAPRVDCLVYGDSFSVNLVPFLAESFGRLVFAHIPTLDYELLEREQPDVVVGLTCERFMISIPNDTGGPTLDELAASKRAAGNLWPPRTWKGTRLEG